MVNEEKIENKKSSKKFKNVHIKLNDNVKSCPKCGKIVHKNVKKCSNCGYSFDGKTNSLLGILFTCLLVMGTLFLLVYFDVSFVILRGLKNLISSTTPH